MPSRSSRSPSGWSRRPPDGWWPPPSKPIPVKGGVTARSKRGQIGATWWSRRFIAVLESLEIGGRLQRGKRYARAGQVVSLDILTGQVRASVQGSRSKPYRVFVETAVLSDAEWGGIEDVMASRAVFLAKLLSGEMPEEIEEAFAECSTSLFPASGDDLVAACSCPDWENPCKHVAAVFYLMAEAFDIDPFLIFAWRGRDKERLLVDLRARRRGPGVGASETEGSGSGSGSEDNLAVREFGWPVFDPGAERPARASDAASFWGSQDDVSAIEVRPRLAIAADLALRQLDPAPLGEDAGIVDELRPLYERITANAIALAFGEESASSSS